MTPRRNAISFSLLVVTSCGGETLRIGDDDAPPAGTSEVSSIELSPELRARCEASLVGEVPGGDRMAALLVGRWVRCRGDGRGVLHFAGIEMGVEAPLDRKVWYALEPDGGGGFRRASDLTLHGTYGAQAPLTLIVRFDGGSETQLVVLFHEETGRIHVVRDLISATDVVFVRL